jgi:hypothetical protein
MKKLAVLLALTFLIVSCDELNDLADFEFDYETTFTVPGTIPVAVKDTLESPVIETEMDEYMTDNNTDESKINKITLEELTLSINSPANSDFSFLKEIMIYIKADGMEEKMLASKTNITESIGDTLKFETTSDDLQEYMFKENYQMKAVVETQKAIDQDYELNAYVRFKADADVLNEEE